MSVEVETDKPDYTISDKHWYQKLLTRAKKERLGYPLSHFPNPVALALRETGTLVAEVSIDQYRSELMDVELGRTFDGSDAAAMVDRCVRVMRTLAPPTGDYRVVAYCLVGPRGDSTEGKVICEKYQLVDIVPLFTWEELVSGEWDTTDEIRHRFQWATRQDLPVEFEYFARHSPTTFVTCVEFVDVMYTTSRSSDFLDVVDKPDDVRTIFEFLTTIGMQTDLIVLPDYLEHLRDLMTEQADFSQARKQYHTRVETALPVVAVGEDGQLPVLSHQPRHVICVTRDAWSAVSKSPYLLTPPCLRMLVTLRSTRYNEDLKNRILSITEDETENRPWSLTQVSRLGDTNMFFTEYEIGFQE